MQFIDLNLIDPLLRAVAAEGYEIPTPIQQQAIPPILEGRDLLGCAQTGTGKTAAFALPILQRLTQSAAPEPRGSNRARPIRVLVLTPTRELAAQIGESFGTYGRNLRFRHTVIFGGVGQQGQEQALARGPEIVVATPGRLLDLSQQRKIDLREIEIFVLDEADRMLDMGFIHDVRRVIALLPQRRQTLLFSATMPSDIVALSASILVDPARVAVTPISSTVDKVEQRVFFVEKSRKRALLETVLRDPAIERVLVFTRTKHGANRVAEGLVRARIGAEVIHGNKSQNARERALSSFKSGTTRVLVATDIAARGLDVEGVSHVINFDLPDVPESYVHRIGRTARAGASGTAFSFCDSEEVSMLGAIERLIRVRIPVDGAHALRDMDPAAPRSSQDDRPPGRPQGRAPSYSRPESRPHDRSQGRTPSYSRPEPRPYDRSQGRTPSYSRAEPASPQPQPQATQSLSGTAGASAAASDRARPPRPFSRRPQRRYVTS